MVFIYLTYKTAEGIKEPNYLDATSQRLFLAAGK